MLSRPFTPRSLCRSCLLSSNSCVWSCFPRRRGSQKLAPRVRRADAVADRPVHRKGSAKPDLSPDIVHRGWLRSRPVLPTCGNLCRYSSNYIRSVTKHGYRRYRLISQNPRQWFLYVTHVCACSGEHLATWTNGIAVALDVPPPQTNQSDLIL